MLVFARLVGKRNPVLSTDPPFNGFSAGGFRFTLRGEFAQAYQLETSTNLLNWTPLLTLTNWYGQSRFADEAATGACPCFYRAIEA